MVFISEITQIAMKFFFLICVTLFLHSIAQEEDREWDATTAKFSKEMVERVFDIVSPSCKEEMAGNMEAGSSGEYSSSCKAQIKGALRIIEAPKSERAERSGPEKPSSRRQPPHPDQEKDEPTKKSKKSKNSKKENQAKEPSFGIHPMVTTCTYVLFFAACAYVYKNLGTEQTAAGEEEKKEVSHIPTKKVQHALISTLAFWCCFILLIHCILVFVGEKTSSEES